MEENSSQENLVLLESTGIADEDDLAQEVIPHDNFLDLLNQESRNKFLRSLIKHFKSFKPPIIDWLRKYSLPKFKGDLLAALTVAVILIPQGMAYSLLSGLPPIYGLYTSLVPPFIYALFGTSMQLAIGPVAVTCLLTKSGIEAFGISSLDDRIEASIVLAFYSGVLLIIMSFFNLGILVNLLSQVVLDGFISAAAIIIITSQLKEVFGVKSEESSNWAETFIELMSHIPETNWVTFVIGLFCFLILLPFKKIDSIKNISCIKNSNSIFLTWIKKIPKWFPIELIMMIFGIIIGISVHLNISLIGEIPFGFPPITVPNLPRYSISTALYQGMILAVIAYVGSIALAKKFSYKYNYQINANQELFALGTATIGGCFFSGHPIQASFTRTAVAAEMGAQSPLCGVCTSTIILIFLFTLTTFFAYLPKVVLSCIVIISVRTLVEYEKAFWLWYVSKSEFFIFMATFVCTLLVGPDKGILFSVAIALILTLIRSFFPPILKLGKLPHSGTWKNIARFPKAKIFDDILVLRIESDLYFINSTRFRDQVLQIVNEEVGVKFLILDANAINFIDTTAVDMLKGLVDELNNKKIKFVMCNVRGSGRDFLQKTKFTDKLQSKLFFTVDDAVSFCQSFPQAK